jgi:hypothetical protein
MLFLVSKIGPHKTLNILKVYINSLAMDQDNDIVFLWDSVLIQRLR